MEVRVSTVVNYNEYKTFFRFSMFRGKGYRFKSFASVLIMLAAIAVSLSGTILYYNPLILFAFIFSLFMTITLLIIWFYMPRYSYINTFIAKGSKDDFVFLDDIFMVSSVTEYIKSQTEISYSQVFKIYETNKHIYIYLSPGFAYIINKKTFVYHADIAELRSFFVSKMPDKYINCLS